MYGCLSPDTFLTLLGSSVIRGPKFGTKYLLGIFTGQLSELKLGMVWSTPCYFSAVIMTDGTMFTDGRWIETVEDFVSFTNPDFPSLWVIKVVEKFGYDTSELAKELLSKENDPFAGLSRKQVLNAALGPVSPRRAPPFGSEDTG